MGPAEPPNVLVIVSHDTGQHVSPYGIETVHTPNAERLAREGVVLENSFCTAPQCSPFYNTSVRQLRSSQGE